MQNTAIEFERQVADAITRLDYKVIMQPSSKPGHTTWLDRISSWLPKSIGSLYAGYVGGPCKKYAVVEAKPYPILLGPIIQARHYADYFEAPAVVCVPDDAFPEIPESVGEWAELNDIPCALLENRRYAQSNISGLINPIVGPTRPPRRRLPTT